MTYSTLEFDVRGKIAYLFLSSPPQNIMSLKCFAELSNLTQTELVNADIDGLIISGKGRHFSSGADTKELIDILGSKSTDKNEFLKRNIETFSTIEKLNIPVVATVNGCCFGSALELVLACDFIIASKRAIFSMPESEFGLMPGCGGTVRLSERCKKSDVVELILGGKTFDAEEAQQKGVVDYICDKKEIQNIAEDFIKKHATRSIFKL